MTVARTPVEDGWQAYAERLQAQVMTSHENMAVHRMAFYAGALWLFALAKQGEETLKEADDELQRFLAEID